MSSEKEQPERPPNDELQDVFDQLDELEQTVTSSEERREVRQTRRLLERVPGRKRISKYTTRDVAEGFVGGIIFALPLLVEDGVFEIADWFLEVTVASIPVFLLVNFVFVVSLVGGLLHFTDIRDIPMTRMFGLIPKRLTAILVISLLVSFLTMLMWGRLHEEDPTTVEQFSRVTVIWAAAALGASLGDILPGESNGADLATLIGDLGDDDDKKDGSESSERDRRSR